MSVDYFVTEHRLSKTDHKSAVPEQHPNAEAVHNDWLDQNSQHSIGSNFSVSKEHPEGRRKSSTQLVSIPNAFTLETVTNAVTTADGDESDVRIADTVKTLDTAESDTLLAERTRAETPIQVHSMKR